MRMRLRSERRAGGGGRGDERGLETGGQGRRGIEGVEMVEEEKMEGA